MTRETLGERVKAVRESRGLKQEELARRAGVSTSMVSKIEQGVTTQPHPQKFARVAAALGTTVEALMAGTRMDYGSPPDPLLERLRRNFEPGHADVITDWLEETADYTPEDKKFTVAMVEWLRKVMQQADAHRDGKQMQLSSVLQPQR